MKFSLIQQYHIEIKKLIKLATPILFAQIAQNSMGLVDTIMSGRVSSADMAAISVGASIWLPLVLFGHGLLLALPPTISYLNGSGQRKLIAHQVRQGVWIVIFCCLPLGFLIYSSDIVIRFMQMDSHLARITQGYLQAMLWGLPGYLLLVNFRCLNDGIAKTKPAMIITFLGLMLNIPLNYILIYGKFGLPAFGAVGCGIATAIVNWTMCLMMIFYSYKNHNERELKVFSHLLEKPDFYTLKKLLSLGFPIAFAICCEVALFAISALLLSPLGADIVASHQIALNTSSFLFMFPMSIGMATTIMVGQALGAGSPNEAKTITYSALLLGLTIAFLAAIITAVFRYDIAAIFVTDQNVIALSVSLLLIASIYQFSDTIQVIVSGALRGYKDTQIILYITLFCYWVIGIPLGYILARTDWLMPSIGAMGFWIAFVVALTLAASMLYTRIHKIQKLSDHELLQKLERLK
ncbi:MATE family efflux transporter [Rodentibacter caecimuris]|uniref:Multidrug-efflux transporter n=1 Tax=Rodentibacter caecimuris TaxID=1796644 RepID=A0ABX3L0J3_9PAST|nr:MATE family efflux transporter [Rodentibacter heylii]